MSEKQQIIIDLSRLRTKKGVHNRFREALNFPVYYGMNLDALHDCLMEQRDIDLRVRGLDSMERRFGEWGQTLKRVLEDADGENPYLNITLI